MMEIEINQIKNNANNFFKKDNYYLAFETLWETGVSSFILFAQKEYFKKEDLKIQKTNWFTNASGDVFWGKFILQNEIFEKIFNSTYAEQVLHNYFSKFKIQIPEFELKLAQTYPEQFIKAIRLNQVFIKKDRINLLCSINGNEKFKLHQKVWKFANENDTIIWNSIEESLKSIQKYSINDILCYALIWLEEQRFNNRNEKHLYHLASVYSFFIEQFFKTYPDKEKELNSNNFFTNFLDALNKTSSLSKEISIHLENISKWIYFKEDIISPYSFDLNIEIIQEDEQIFFSSNPKSYYNWLLDGARYNYNQLNYNQKAIEKLINLEQTGAIKINGKTETDLYLNRFLATQKMACSLFLKDLCIDTLEIGGNQVNIENLLNPLITYSTNKLSKYDLILQDYFSTSKDWRDAFIKLNMRINQESFTQKPFFLMSVNEYIEKNITALSNSNKNDTINILKCFSYKTNPVKSFNRFFPQYDVWQNPFYKIGEFLFCPMMFFANNNWFYSYTQEALKQKKSKEKDRNETQNMEIYLGDIFKEKKWEVKVINDKEASEIDGDIDIFIEDNTSLLFVQLKRTYFRLNLKDAHFDSVNTDLKATNQLNDAENYLKQHKKIYPMNQKPVKWIVSTSFENIGTKINDCFKVNYFELINALSKPEINTISELISYIEKDNYVKIIVYNAQNQDLSLEESEMYSELIASLKVFKSDKYKQLIFSEDTNKTKYLFDLYEKAIHLDKIGANSEACNLFLKCISLKQNNGSFYSSYANYLDERGLFHEANVEYENALKLLPNDPYILRYYSLSLMSSGKFYEGLKQMLELIEMYPLLGDFQLMYCDCFNNCLINKLLNQEQINHLNTLWNKLK